MKKQLRLTNSYLDNKIWVIKGQEDMMDKDTIYNVQNNQKIDIDSITDVYFTKNSKKTYLCVVTDIFLSQINIEDTLGIVLDIDTLQPKFIHSIAQGHTKKVFTEQEALELTGLKLTEEQRLQLTIAQKFITFNNKDINSIPLTNRHQKLEKVLKKELSV